MDLRDILRQGITFGPFQTDHHRRIVGPEFQDAVFRHIGDKILPELTIVMDGVQGVVEALYDADKYHGPNSAVKYKYRFDARFLQGKRRESVSFSIDYEPGEKGFRLVYGEPRILTARSFERMDEEREAGRRELDRQADAVLRPGRTLSRQWEECARVWTASEHVLGDMLGPVGARPLQHHLCERFAEVHPDSEPFLLEKLRDPNPLLAAYAFKCWIRVAPPEGRLPADVLARTETIRTHAGCFVSETPLGEWMADYWKEEREE